MRAFDPWIGENYRAGFNGKKLLILGESQADHTFNAPLRGRDTDRDATIKIVHDHAVDCKPSLAFFTKITSLMLGTDRRPTDDERRALWQRIAFYNYIQWWMHKPLVPATEEMWAEAREPFIEVLRELQPHALPPCANVS